MRERKNGVIEWTMRHYQITLLVITVLVGLGILGLVDMPKQEFPEFTIRQGVVVGVYPGATSGEVEEQLAKPLERYLFTFKEVKKKKTYSMSRDGMVYVMVELNDDVNNKDEVWSKIKLGLQNFKSQLPSGVLAVIANDDFGDTSALLITLESEDKTYRELQRYMETLEDRLRRIESVSNLRRYGVQNEQISVYLDPDKLAAYGLNTRMLMTTLFTQGFTTASGSLENGGLDIPIHLSVTYPSEREVGEQILLADADGHMIRLKDVARIVREYPEPDSYITNNGKKAIILSMEMREGHNIVRYARFRAGSSRECLDPPDCRPAEGGGRLGKFLRAGFVCVHRGRDLGDDGIVPVPLGIGGGYLHPDQCLYLDRCHVRLRHPAEYGDTGRLDRGIGHDRG